MIKENNGIHLPIDNNIMNMRLDKYLADCGVATRKDLKNFVRKGRVQVDDTVVTDPGYHLNPVKQKVVFDGAIVPWKKTVVFLLNKPAGVITAIDDKKLPTVMDILPEKLQRMNLMPVGRLDRDTEGLLLLTNDGNLAHELITPKKHVEKEYCATLDVMPKKGAEDEFMQGITLADGTVCRPAGLVRVSQVPPIVHVTLIEGKFHQVKRMLAAVGSHVLGLKRVRIGSIFLDEKLETGAFRELTEDEVRMLHYSRD